MLRSNVQVLTIDTTGGAPVKVWHAAQTAHPVPRGDVSRDEPWGPTEGCIQG